MGITIEQAKKLTNGDIVYSNIGTNSDGSPQRFRVNGQPKTWKRDPNRIKVPLKYGLYGYGELTNGTWEGNRFTLHLEHVELNESDAYWINCKSCNEKIFPYKGLTQDQKKFIENNTSELMIIRCSKCNHQNEIKITY